MAQMINGSMTWQLRDWKKWRQRACAAALIAAIFNVAAAEVRAEDAATPPSPTAQSSTPAPVIPVPLTANGGAPANTQNVGMPNSEKPNASAAPSAASNSSSLPTDHDIVVGSWGLGFLGTVQVPLPLAVPVGRSDQAGMSPNDQLTSRTILVPTLGFRKWFSKRRGFDAGLGVVFSTGADSATYGSTKSSVDKESVFALAAHVGVPLVVVDTRHMAFLIAPEAKVAFATSNIAAEFEENAPPDAKLRGISANLGLRAGAELHFGFMGLPRLSLQAGVGLYVTAQWASASVSNQSLSTYDMSIGMGSVANPWDIFNGFANLSARYYF